MAEPIEGFKSWDEAYIEETRDRESIEPDRLCTYGVKALDDALFRIGTNELVVIGAETGMGKSELSLNIAQHNAVNGKRVAVYYLEGGHLEAIRRMKWKDITKMYFKDYRFARANVDFKQWMYNYNPEHVLIDIEGKVNNQYREKYKENLYFYPTTKEFTIEKFMMSLLDFHQLLTADLDLDLIIIDHLQYFSLAQADNEISEITKILREVKEITEYYNTPVILISHLRKRGKNAGLPGHEDFYGSGNIAKIATTAITIAPDPEGDSLADNIYPTFLRVVKSRVGIRPNYAFLVNFDLKTRSYEEDYQIYRVNELGQPASAPLLENELPKWARKEEKKDDRIIEKKDRYCD